MKQIYFVRHGEAEGNLNKTAQTPKTPLTERGHAQAKTVAARVASLAPQTLLVSPFVRAQQTAAPIAHATSLPIETLESVQERKNPTSLWNKPHDSEEYQTFKNALLENIADPEWRWEDGESFNEIFIRCKATYDLLLDRSESCLVVVTHAAFLKFFAAYVLLKEDLTAELMGKLFVGLEYADNTSITQFTQTTDTTLSLTMYNDIAHFAE